MWRGSAVPRKALRPGGYLDLRLLSGGISIKSRAVPGWSLSLLPCLPTLGVSKTQDTQCQVQAFCPIQDAARAGGNRKTSEPGALGGRDPPRPPRWSAGRSNPAQGSVRFLLSSFCSDNSGTGSFIHSFAQHLVTGHLPTLRAAAVPGAGGSAVTTHTCLLLSPRVHATGKETTAK